MHVTFDPVAPGMSCLAAFRDLGQQEPSRPNYVEAFLGTQSR